MRDRVDEILLGTSLEVIRIKNKRIMERAIQTVSEDETLDDLDPKEVFIRCLDAFDVPEENRAELTGCYQLIMKELYEEDQHAE